MIAEILFFLQLQASLQQIKNVADLSLAQQVEIAAAGKKIAVTSSKLSYPGLAKVQNVIFSEAVKGHIELGKREPGQVYNVIRIYPGVIGVVQNKKEQTLQVLNDGVIDLWCTRIVYDRNMIFEYTMGMYEAEFRDAATKTEAFDSQGKSAPEYEQGRKPKPHKDRVRAWWKANKDRVPERGRKAIEKCKDTYRHVTVEDLRNKVRQSLEESDAKGSFEVIYNSFDQDQQFVADVRYLQAQHPEAVFQIASNFNSLEGGLGDYRKNISAMNQSPVQGENACIATPAGVIVRRYFYRADNLLYEWRTYFEIDESKQDESLNNPYIKDYSNASMKVRNISANKTYNPLVQNIVQGKQLSKDVMDNIGGIRAQLVGRLQVGIHTDVTIFSEYPIRNQHSANVEIPRRKGKKSRPAFDYQVTDERKVHQIFTAAINRMSGVVGLKDKALAELVLLGMYEGTILAAHDILKNQKQKKLFLTMVGGGAFGNESQWIVEALTGLKELIVASDLDITMVIFVPESRKELEPEFKKLKSAIAEVKSSGKSFKESEYYKQRFDYELVEKAKKK